MNLLHLEQFYEVAKAGSVSTGARKLRLSQPAVSKAIRLLEESLEAKLFERTRSGVVLTAAGEIAFSHASRIFAEARALQNGVETAKDSLRGDWCLGASDNLAIHLLPPVFARVKVENPELRLQLFSGTSSAIKEELYADRCDAGLFFTPPSASEPLRAEVVLETEFWVVLGAEFPGLKKNTRAGAPKKWTVADLKAAGIPQIESRHKDYAGGIPAHFHARKLGFDSLPYIQTNLHEVKKRLVLEGAGFGILVKHAVENDVKSGKLIRVQTPAPLPAPIYWVTRKGRPPQRAGAEFLKTAQKLGVLRTTNRD